MADGGIEYESGEVSPVRREKGGDGLAGFFVRIGFAKDVEQANKVLIGILVVSIVVGVGVWFVL
jgi:hypothetical protein